MPSRNRQRTPHLCFDRILTDAQRLEAARRAVSENPANIPMLTSLPVVNRAAVDPQELALETRTLWKPGRMLRVRFLDGDPVVQSKVVEAARTWEQYANIKFSFGGDPQAEIRIAFQPDAGSWSYLGTDALGIPADKATMNLGWLTPTTPNEEYSRVVLHEFGHALGCIHEHQHPTNGIPWNKPAVYRVYAGPPNYWDKNKVDFNLFRKYTVDQTQYSEFDRHSIMLYSIPKELTDGIFEVGSNWALSDLDRQYIGAVYPFDLTPVTELVLEGAPFEAGIGVHGEEDLYRFSIAQAGVHTIETSGRTDVQLGLYGPDNRQLQIGFDDDSGKGLNARLSLELQPGVYYARVRHYRPRGLGKYALQVYAGSPKTA